MAIPSKPLHIPTLSFLSLKKDRVQSLLGKEITLYFGGADKKAKWVITTVGEIYQRCQKTLSKEFGRTPLIIRGSSVSNLFSGEPFTDVDIHGIIDVRDLESDERIRRGYQIKWAVLEAISEIISDLLPSTSEGSRGSISSAEILYEEKTNLLCTKKAPFNVHTILLPGDIPIEFTIFNIVNEIEQSVRNYDFNSGSLQLCIEEGERITIHSSTPDILETIRELSRRELTCDRPEDIEKKSLCRYLAKLVVSGYYDKDTDLLHRMLEGVKIRNTEEKKDRILAAGIIQEILAHFKEKELNPSAALLSLWLLLKPKHCPEIFGALLEEAKEKLNAALLTDTLPERKALSILVQKGKKAECCWYLIMQAKRARKVLHRGEESLQLESPAYPMFTDEPSDRSVFIIVPISGLLKFSESIIPWAFFDLQEKKKPKLQVEGAEIEDLFQHLFTDLLTKSSLYPVLLTVMDLLGIEAKGDFSKHFVDWIKLNDSLSEVDKVKIPLVVLKKLRPTLLKALEDQALIRECEELLEVGDLKSLPIFSMLKMLYQLVGKEGLCSFDSIYLQRIITRYTERFFFKREKFGFLSPEDEDIMLDFAKAHVEEICKRDKLQVYKKKGEDPLCKRTLYILYVLFIKKYVGVSEGVLGSRLCFELGYLTEGLKFLKALVSTSDSLEYPEIESFFNHLSESLPLEFATFLKENTALIKQKTKAFSSIIIPFLEKLTAKKLTADLIEKFNEVVDALCDDEEKDKIIKILLVRAAKGHPQCKALLDGVKDYFKRSIFAGYSTSEMSKDELIYLSGLDGFEVALADDSKFATDFISRAAQVQNRDLVIQGSLHLAKANPLGCLYSVDILDSMRKDSKDLTTLLPSLNTLVQLLENYPGLIMTNSMCMRLIEARLKDLLIYFQIEQEKFSKGFNSEFFATLREFHKKVALYTLEHPCWDIVWDSEGQAIKDWFNPADILISLPRINPNGAILKLIKVFAMDGPFIYQLIWKISTLPNEVHEAFSPVVQSLLEKSIDGILREAPLEPPVEASEVISFIGKVKVFFVIPQDDLFKVHSMNMNICSFTAAYGRKEIESVLLNHFNQIYNTNNDDIKKFLPETTLPHKCLFLFAKRAMARQDFLTLSKICHSYTAWGRTKTPYQYFTVEDIHFQSNQWMEFLRRKDGFFSDGARNITFSTTALEFHALWFYFLFLEDTIKGEISSKKGVLSASVAQLNEVNFSHLLEFIEFLTKKKLIRFAGYMTGFLVIAENLNSKQLELLTTRCTYMAINMLEGMLKQPIQQEDLTSFMELVKLIDQLLGKAKDSKEIKNQAAVIMHFLQTAWMVFPHFIGQSHHLLECMEDFSSIEGTLSLKDLRIYHRSWLESILARKETIHRAEMEGWLLLCLRLTPSALKFLSKESYPEKFVGKHFITQEYFANPIAIKTFLEILDVAIERFLYLRVSSPVAGGVAGVTDVSRIMNTDIFNYLLFYGNFLEEGIKNMKGKMEMKSESIELEKIYVSLFVKGLKTPKLESNFKPLSIRYLLPCISEDLKGTVIFRRGSEMTLEKQVEILYLLAVNQVLLKKGQHELEKMNLKKLYENEKARIQRVLSPSQMKEIELIYNDPCPSKAAGSGSSVGNSWW